jgi:hypothetical protein
VAALSEEHMCKASMLVIAVGLSMALPIFAEPQQESLGDLARQLRAQREKEAKKPVRVITNDNLPPRPAGGEGLTAASGISETPAGGEKANPTPPTTKTASAESPREKTGTEPESPDSKVKTRDYWQAKFTAARQALARAKEEQQLAEDELNLLQIQEARELDPMAKQDLGDKIQAKQSEVEGKRAAREKVQKALDELEQEFNASGAPEDWSQTD